MGGNRSLESEVEPVAGWSFRCGRKAVSAVRAYERPGGASLYIEWYDRGDRIQRSLKAITGHPVTDKRLAMQIAREIARGLEARANQRARRVVFGGSDYTLDELVEEYHNSARARTWSDHHRKGMDRWRDFWLDHYRGVYLTDINAAMVERDVAALDASPETRRKYLVYLTGAYNYAVRKLKWIDARHDLSAVELPKPQRGGSAYSLDEVQRLLRALEGICDRAGWVGHVAVQTGRRLSAIQAIRPDDVEVFGDYTVVTFHRDKAGKVSDSVVAGRAHEIAARLTSYTFTDHEARHWIRDAEKAAGVPHVRGRGWHGLKRAYATLAAGEAAAAKQSGTRRETLAGIYEQEWIDPKVDLARKLASVTATVSKDR